MIGDSCIASPYSRVHLLRKRGKLRTEALLVLKSHEPQSGNLKLSARSSRSHSPWKTDVLLIWVLNSISTLRLLPPESETSLNRQALTAVSNSLVSSRQVGELVHFINASKTGAAAEEDRADESICGRTQIFGGGKLHRMTLQGPSP